MIRTKLKIGFTDFIPSLEKFFLSVLSHYYDIEIDNQRPDYLFFSTEDFGTQNKKFDVPGGPIKILFTGENRRPQNYTCHYAISFDHLYDPWHYRLPLYVVDMWCIPNDAGLKQYPYTHILDYNYKWQEHGKIDGKEIRDFFCGFVHRNGNNQVRNYFFHELSKYKHVTSAGPLFNNTGSNVEGIGGKIDFFKRCKFALCFENSRHPGYVTEKILHAFYAGAIPIYWGSQTIDLDFNPESFIDVGKFFDIHKAIDKIKEIDENVLLSTKMLKAEKLRHNIPNDRMLLTNFLNWFDAVVYQKRYERKI